MKTKIKTSDTRQPKLTSAVLRQLGGRDSLEDVCNHGASGGCYGFTYYTDTLKFFEANKAAIMSRLTEDARDYGMGMLAMVASFGCLKADKLTSDQVAAAIYEDTEDSTNVKNALAWYALEEIARELCPDL